MQGSLCACVHGYVTQREKERRSLQACSQTLWGCSSSDKKGRDSPSVSVDSGLWKHTGQSVLHVTKRVCFPESAIFHGLLAA